MSVQHEEGGERATDGQLEVRMPHLVEEEAIHQSMGKGCATHAWWSRRSHATEARPTTSEGEGRLLEQP
jgi:hypothetical protein